MSYNRNIPAATDLISNSQSQIQGNFQTIDSGSTGTGVGFSRNHVTMTDGTNGGLHNRIDFYQALSDPTVSGFVSSLYPKTISAATELCYSNSTGVLTQITSGALPIWKGGTVGTSGIATATAATNGQLNLPNGIQIRWGLATGISTGGTAVSFSPAFTSNFFSLTITPLGTSSRGVAYGSQSRTGFTCYTENNGTTVTYIAIGN